MTKDNNNKRRKYLIIFWSLFAAPFITIAIIFTLIAYGKLGYMPSFEELENPDRDLAAQVISEDQKLLGKIFRGNQTRVTTSYDQLSPYLVNALIATEDIRFYKHSGIDARGLARVAFKTILSGDRDAGGGSTVSQQLAKLLFPRDTTTYHSSLVRNIKLVNTKFREWVTAVKLEKRYTKQEIISMYFNQFDFLYLAVGIQSASKVYFNSSPDSLNLQQAATLVGMLKNPSYFNPVRRPDITKNRRNVVLRQMLKYGYIEPAVYDSVSALPMKTDFQRMGHNIGYATYFREYLRTTMQHVKPERSDYNSYSSYQTDSARWIDDPLFGWCNKNLKPDGTAYDLYRDGLRIFTTINYDMQRYAEWAVQEHLGKTLQPLFFKSKKGYTNAPFSKDLTRQEVNDIMHRAMLRSSRYWTHRNHGIPHDTIMDIFHRPVEMKVFSWEGQIDTVMTPYDSIRYHHYFLRSGLMSMDPTTGHVKAYVGGIDNRYFAYDHVTQAKRQAGSVFKPFLYILAMQEGYSPCHKVPVVPRTFEVNDTIWQPRTTGLKYVNTVQTLKWGLAKSENYISAWLLKQFNPQSIAEIAYKMGIESHIDPVPSMIYGVSEVSVYEMVSSFSTLANKGIHIEPLFVTRIEDKHGNIISSFVPEKEEAISEHTAYLMLNLMEGVVNFGTAYRLRSGFEFTAEIAGKTGTTQNHSDGWFMGITPKLVTGMWVGGEVRSVHFDALGLGSGSAMALPIWGNYMQKIYENDTLNITQEDVFEKPENLTINLNCDDVTNRYYEDNEFEFRDR
jgi:penicillin-binding protein 1A